MATNVMREIGIVMGTWYVDFCIDNGARSGSLLGGQILTCSCVSLPGNGARNSSCYLLSTALDFPEEERMMEQSCVSMSLRFLEPRYQSSWRPRSSPSYLNKNNSSTQPTRLGVVNPFTVSYGGEI